MALVDTPRTHTEVQGRTAVRTVPLSAERTATGLKVSACVFAAICWPASGSPPDLKVVDFPAGQVQAAEF